MSTHIAIFNAALTKLCSMVNEYWGTLSLYDHRDAMFIKSLVLFDRIVIPVPNKPIHDITSQELDRLSADAAFLEDSDAAIIYPWEQDQFDEWRDSFLKESLAAKSTDLLYDSRLWMTAKSDQIKPHGVYDVTAVPIYGAKAQYENIYGKLESPKNNQILELSQLISVPNGVTPLQDIVELRNKESFQSARRALRKWQVDTMPELLSEPSEKLLAKGMEDFKEMLRRYEEEINKGNFKTRKIVVTSLLALGSLLAGALGHTATAIAIISGAAPNLFSLKESNVPAWKDLRDKPFEAAGVIYQANKALENL
ncbi:MAG TPA: hypothetical protein DCO83_04750 [Mucilaginibacter sp.]|nr:hypothetical protein [Mucilaginibacter sp.]